MVDPLVDWFDKFYFSQKKIKYPSRLVQSLRYAEILREYRGLSVCEVGFGKESNLRGLMSEVAGRAIFDYLTGPAFSFRISTGKEDRFGADILCFNGDYTKPSLAIDTKTGAGGKPKKSQQLKAPILTFCLPCDEWGLDHWVGEIQKGSIKDPYEYVGDIGIEGYRESGLIGSLQYQAGRMLTHNILKYNMSNPIPMRFLNSICEI